VTVGDEGYACRICVDGIDVAKQILRNLSAAFIFSTSEPIQISAASAHCTFRVAYGSQLSHRKLVSLLSAASGVRLRPDLAGNTLTLEQYRNDDCFGET
jgi:hypothetical protein